METTGNTLTVLRYRQLGNLCNEWADFQWRNLRNRLLRHIESLYEFALGNGSPAERNAVAAPNAKTD